MTNDWKPYEGPAFDFSRTALHDNWETLHQGNLEKLPESLKAQEAWRAYHEGRFADAVAAGETYGNECLLPAAFAATIYSEYIEIDDGRKADLFKRAMDLAEQALENNPESANAYYILAVALGRHSKFINMTDALSQGIGPKIRDAATDCLELEPGHSEGHVTLAAWHAEVVDKLGSMLAGLSFGAKKEIAEEHFDKALQLCSKSPIPYIEKGRGLLLMYGEMREDDARKHLEHAIKLSPTDAMQAMDIERTRVELSTESA